MTDPVLAPTCEPAVTQYREIAVDVAAVAVIITGLVMSYQRIEITNLFAGAFGTCMMYLFGKYTPNSA
jgi:hypothetical protein